MKKIVVALLCLLLAVSTLAGCASDVIGSYRPNYDYEPEEIEDLTMNLYIICDDATTENAKITVQQRISAITDEAYHTKLNVIYCREADYEVTIQQATADGATDRAHIVMVNSADTMSYLTSRGLAADLLSYLDTKTYGKLNTQIAKSLLDAAKVKVLETAADGTEKQATKLYAIPNNHVLGHYEYLLINTEIATHKYHYGKPTLQSYTTYEQTQELREHMTANGDDPDQYVKCVQGSYADKARYEAEGYVCNIVSAPQVTREEAFSGAFAAINDPTGAVPTDRIMEIIYALNTNAELHNCLQYGIANTNYMLHDGEVVYDGIAANDTYRMNPLYTGDIFGLYNCGANGWDDVAKANGKLQNDAAVNAAS